MIEVKNLVKRYGTHSAVDHLNFTVKKGQIYGFLGPNGAGKSTTMNIMTGYLGATEGEVLINGHDILKEPELAKKSIGYLPEMPPLYTEMTVIEYLWFAAELKKIPKQEREETIEKSVALTMLEDVKHRLIKNLSKGYKQRVGLAQAVLGFPEIIILDEPTVGLDPKQIIEIRELIRELAKEHTIILSSHILAEVREVCDYIMIISEGKLVASDTPENLERMMNGSEKIIVETRADKEKTEEILHNITETVMECDAEEEGIFRYEIENCSQEDMREDIFRAFAKADCPLLTIYRNKVSLEEVFLELTEQSPETDDENEEMELEETKSEGGREDESDI